MNYSVMSNCDGIKEEMVELYEECSDLNFLPYRGLRIMKITSILLAMKLIQTTISLTDYKSIVIIIQMINLTENVIQMQNLIISHWFIIIVEA